MRLADEVSIRPLAAAGDDPAPSSRVLLHGRDSATIISGCVLEAAVEAEGRYLLFVTNDCPYEELLHLHLLDAAGRALDSAALGMPYATGAFGNLRLLPPDRIGFDFFDEKDWEVELLPAPRLRLPLLSEPLGVWRARPLRCHFVLRARDRAPLTS